MLVLRTKKWQRIAVASVLTFGLLLLFELLPRAVELISRSFTLHGQRSELRSAKASVTMYQQYMLENKELRQHIQQLTRSSSGKGSLADVLTAIELAAERSGVRIGAIVPKTVQTKDHLILQPVELTVHADFESVYRFVGALEAQEPVTMVQQVTILPTILFSGDVESTISVQICLNL